MTNPRGRNTSAFSKEPARLPALPTVRVDDASMQRFVNAVAEWIEVRSGARGDKFERAITVRDLVELGVVDPASLGRGALRGPGEAAGQTEPSLIVETDQGKVRMTIEAFARSIMDTRLFRDLMLSLRDPKRFDGLPEAVKQILTADLLEEAAKRGADIRRLETKIQTETESLAVRVEEVTAALGNAVAGVRDTVFASATTSQASAGKITQISAAIGDPGTFTANGVTLEEAMFGIASLDQGLYGQYTLKINANNHIAGFGLAVEATGANQATSAFIVAADKFAVVGAADTIPDPLNPPTNRVPFGVDTVNNTIYINGQVRINTGTGTKLEDLGSATSYYLLTSAGAIRRNSSNVYVPTTLVVEGRQATGTSVSPYAGRFIIATTPDGTTWTDRYTSAANESSYTWTVAPATGITQIRVRLYQAGGVTNLLDEQILPIVVDGAVGADGRPAITVIVQNAAHTVPADNAGNVTSYANSEVRISVWEGSTPLTFNTSDIGGTSRFYVSGPVVDAGSITAGLYLSGAGTTTFVSDVHSNMTTDTARIRRTITVRRSDGSLDPGSYPATQTLTKARQGQQGVQGPQGPQGVAGNPGARGSLTGNGSQYGISTGSWVDGLANRVINNMLTGETFTSSLGTTTHLRIGDSVTLGNGSTFAQTRYWSGTSWITPGVVIDGNLIVNGTIVADKLGANSVTADKISATALNGKTITGSLIRTAASGARVEISNVGNTLAGYNSAGTLTYLLDMDSGIQDYSGTSPVYVSRVRNLNTGPGVAIEGQASGTGAGVRGQSLSSGSGVFGTSLSGPGVFGQSTSGPGGRFSTVQIDAATGTSPMTVSSTTLVANLNADLLDGEQAAALAQSVGAQRAGIGNTTATGGGGNVAFNSTTKPGPTQGGLNNVWLEIRNGSSTFWVPAWSN